MDPKDDRLSLGELRHLDGLITILEEQGLAVDDVIITGEDGCCGAIAATAHENDRFASSVHDREILARIRELESQLESAPTLGELIELRGRALRPQG
ncbi:hypothetical protein [Georgenia muralis]|uniref:Uncharacterized protein n=1 Tax=Georgenia muralis TaxID=154117 RepID=A0A3N4Z533_9MICO|nr:hypothetical protein [Georgenia muralis]RPF26230.1 hypothetical protein EDD32_0662 [Georgenia muralis]